MKKETFKTLDGFEYLKDEFGVIHQVNPDPIKYDGNYVETYRSPEYKEKSALLMGLRLGGVISIFSQLFGKHPATLLDVGYGDGSFLKAASEIVPTCYGLDITEEEPPKGCGRVHDYRYNFDVVTFWDAFEHIPNLEFIRDVRAKLIVISLPNVKDKDFETWKHRKPEEHLHHFTPESLRLIMHSFGWNEYGTNFQEDTVRKGEPQNILTSYFIKA